MRLVRGFDLKELVRALERHILCLEDEEEDKQNRQEHRASEEEVDSVAHGQGHLGREARDDGVPKPVVCGCRCLAERSRLLREHLRVDDPRGSCSRDGV